MANTTSEPKSLLQTILSSVVLLGSLLFLSLCMMSATAPICAFTLALGHVAMSILLNESLDASISTSFMIGMAGGAVFFIPMALVGCIFLYRANHAYPIAWMSLFVSSWAAACTAISVAGVALYPGDNKDLLLDVWHEALVGCIGGVLMSTMVISFFWGEEKPKSSEA